MRFSWLFPTPWLGRAPPALQIVRLVRVGMPDAKTALRQETRGTFDMARAGRRVSPHGARRSFGVAASAGAVALVIALAGCTLVGSNTPAPAASKTASSALTALVPTYPAKLTAATAKSGTVAAADAIQKLIASTDIVNVDDKSQLVAATKTAGSYYGVERAVTTSTGFDIILQAQAMEKLLVQAGWIERQTSTTTVGYSVAMSVDTAAGTAILLLVADETPKTPPAIVIELESPDLPKS